MTFSEITDIIKGSLVTFARDANSDNPTSNGYLYLETSPHNKYDSVANLIPVTEEGSGIFKIIGDAYVQHICCFVKYGIRQCDKRKDIIFLILTKKLSSCTD